MLNYSTYKHSTVKDWVTFVHGAGGSSAIWFQQIKSFKANFNVLVVDLRGHGKSKPSLKDTFKQKYTFNAITNDIVEVLDFLKIEKSHFAGISLGTILIRNLAENYPQRVKSMVMGGAVMSMNFKSKILLKTGIIFKSIISYMLLYKLFAFVIMPKKNHKKSRLLFINEAKKLCQKEFIRWFKLTSELNSLLRFFRIKDIQIPTLYIMGEQDHLFLPAVKNVVAKHLQASLLIIKECGHVVNVEQAKIFNQHSIHFIEKHI